MRICRCTSLAPHTAQHSSNGQAAASAVSENVFVLSEGKVETHLSEEHRENSQAEPVDDASKLECIINCKGKKQNNWGFFFEM